MVSISSSDSLMPAVSISSAGTPPKPRGSLMVSLVVPGKAVTMALGRPSKLLKRLDLPTFGRPTKAIVKPSCKSFPRANVAANSSSEILTRQRSATMSSSASSGRSSSTNSSDDSRRTITWRRAAFTGCRVCEISPFSWRVAWRAAAAVLALIRSRIASASVRGIRPLRTARSENSPGSARRASSFRSSSIKAWSKTGEPWQWSSTRSSPVNE